MSFTQKDLLNSCAKIDSGIQSKKTQESKLIDTIKKQNKRIKASDQGKAATSGKLI